MTQEQFTLTKLQAGVSMSEINKLWAAQQKEALSNATYKAYVDTYEMVTKGGKTKSGKCVYIAQFDNSGNKLGQSIIGFGKRKAIAIAKCTNLQGVIAQYLETAADDNE